MELQSGPCSVLKAVPPEQVRLNEGLLFYIYRKAPFGLESELLQCYNTHKRYFRENTICI